jgi:hypothetical protein
MARRRVGRDHRLLACREQREKRAGEIVRVVDAERVAPLAHRREARRERRHARPKRIEADRLGAVAAYRPHGRNAEEFVQRDHA